MGFSEVLVIALVVLKLTGFISISWFMCFLPIIISLSLAVIFMLVSLIISLFIK